jgi:fatty-acyl-CoA synthase
MMGYYAMGAETAATIDRLPAHRRHRVDGRSGFLTFPGRIKDMIIRGGMNIYPAEIEGVLESHPSIQSAAVIGVPDEKWGEQIAAVLKLRRGFSKSGLEDLTSFLRAQIAPHKTPVFWAFVDKFPMTPSGKLQKFVLRDQAVAGSSPSTWSAQPGSWRDAVQPGAHGVVVLAEHGRCQVL